MTTVKGCSLTGGVTKSCGCLRKKTKHGDSRGKIRSRFFSIYHNMKSRCYNKGVPGYKDYGAKGIKLCPEWEKSYEEFKRWALDNGYDDSLSIDRIDNDGPYTPSNCRWVDRVIQNNNKSNHLIITAYGKSMNAKQWANETGISYSTIVSRYHRGLPPEEILRGGG